MNAELEQRTDHRLEPERDWAGMRVPSGYRTRREADQAEFRAWRRRELAPVYPVVFFDTVLVRVRDRGHIYFKQVNLALAVRRDGGREVLGFWPAPSGDPTSVRGMLRDLTQRGVADILIAVVDDVPGLSISFPDYFPQAQVFTGILQLLRASTALVVSKDAAQVGRELRQIFQAETAAAGRHRLEVFAASPLGMKYPALAVLWHEQWGRLESFFAYPPEVRQVVYTTYALDMLQTRLTRLSKNRSIFPDDETMVHLFYLAQSPLTKTWKKPPRAWNWRAALLHLARLFPMRLPLVQTESR